MYSDATYKVKKTIGKENHFHSVNFLSMFNNSWIIVFYNLFIASPLFFWIANNNYIPRTPGIILTIVGLLIFVSTIAVCSLYLWYFTSNIIYKKLDQKPISEFLNKDKIYIYLKPFLTKLKIINS